MEFHVGTRHFRIDIVRRDCERTIQHRFFVRISPEKSVANRNLLERVNVLWVEFNRALEITRGLFPATLPPLDETFQLEYSGIIGQRLASSFQFSQSAVVIEVSTIKIPRDCEMCVACIGTEANRGRDRGFCHGQAIRSMVVAKEVKYIMSIGELAIRFEKGRIMRDCLVQQADRLQQIRSCFNTKARGEDKVLAANI